MDTAEAFALGQEHRGKELMVFDWELAARLIVKHGATEARAGLAGDWEWTGGRIWTGGRPTTDDYAYLASTWATPELEIDGVVYDCFRMESATPGWDARTKWPAEALAVLRRKGLAATARAIVALSGVR